MFSHPDRKQCIMAPRLCHRPRRWLRRTASLFSARCMQRNADGFLRPHSARPACPSRCLGSARSRSFRFRRCRCCSGCADINKGKQYPRRRAWPAPNPSQLSLSRASDGGRCVRPSVRLSVRLLSVRLDKDNQQMGTQASVGRMIDEPRGRMRDECRTVESCRQTRCRSCRPIAAHPCCSSPLSRSRLPERKRTSFGGRTKF